MPLDSVSIETLKEYLDKETYLNVVKEEAIKKASSFKYRLNVFYKEDKIYLQLKGTIGYDNKKKLWVNCSLGSISYDELKAIDKQEIVLKHKTVMQEKAKDAILNQFLK